MAVAKPKPAEAAVTELPPAIDWGQNGVKVPEFDKEQEFKALQQMLLIRRFEEKAGQMYGMGLIGGFCHLYIGQEAVVVGMEMAKEPGDQMITGYRDHGHMLACGMDPKGVMAELTGRRGGYSKGKGGSMHMFSRDKNFYGGHGIVGAQVPLGTGLAFANKYRGAAFLGADRFLETRSLLQHSRTTGRRNGRTHRQSRGRSRHRLVPRGQGSDDPGNDDVSLQGPLHVRSGEIPDQGGGRQSPQ